MSGSWIVITPKILEGVRVINSIEPSKLRLLLSRIAIFMQNGTSRKISCAPFTEEEEIKLEKSLCLDVKDVRSAIDTSTLILQQAAYHVMKPDILRSKLIESLHLEHERATVIVTVWSSNASQIVECLRKQSVLPYQLEDISWLLNVQSSSSKVLRMKDTVAIMELLLHSSENDCSERVTLEMRKPELEQLYQNLEKIQTQLDALK